MRENPLNNRYQIVHYFELLFARQYGEAYRKLESSGLASQVDLLYHFDRLHYISGNYEEAAKALEQDPDKNKSAALVACLVKLGRISEAEQIKREIEPKIKEWNDPIESSLEYAFLGETEKALDYLELAYERKQYQLMEIKVHPYFDLLRDEPRFQAILKKMNFPEVVE